MRVSVTCSVKESALALTGHGKWRSRASAGTAALTALRVRRRPIKLAEIDLTPAKTVVDIGFDSPGRCLAEWFHWSASERPLANGS